MTISSSTDATQPEGDREYLPGEAMYSPAALESGCTSAELLSLDEVKQLRHRLVDWREKCAGTVRLIERVMPTVADLTALGAGLAVWDAPAGPPLTPAELSMLRRRLAGWRAVYPLSVELVERCLNRAYAVPGAAPPGAAP